MGFVEFLMNFNLHFLLTAQERPKRTFRQPLLVAFIHDHHMEYDDEARMIMQQLLDHKARICWLYDQWYHWLLLTPPFPGANPVCRETWARLEDTAAREAFRLAKEAA